MRSSIRAKRRPHTAIHDTVASQLRITIDCALNKPFAEWNEVFPNAACIVTLIDRLVHHAEIVQLDGDSYRLKEAKEEAAKKAKERAARRRRRP